MKYSRGKLLIDCAICYVISGLAGASFLPFGANSSGRGFDTPDATPFMYSWAAPDFLARFLICGAIVTVVFLVRELRNAEPP